jgi:hypothetical protein
MEPNRLSLIDNDEVPIAREDYKWKKHIHDLKTIPFHCQRNFIISPQIADQLFHHCHRILPKCLLVYRSPDANWIPRNTVYWDKKIT